MPLNGNLQLCYPLRHLLIMVQLPARRVMRIMAFLFLPKRDDDSASAPRTAIKDPAGTGG